MDERHFDLVARLLGSAPTRRLALRGLAAAALGSLFGVAGRDDAEAKKNRRRRRRRRRGCGNGKKKCGGKCIKKSNCCSSSECGPCEACQNGACVTTCVAGQSCENGQCTCGGTGCPGCCQGNSCQPGDSTQLCGLNGAICLTCGTGQTCQGGACTCTTASCNGCCDGNTCRTDRKRCGNACIALDACCTGSDCPNAQECVDHQCVPICTAAGGACESGETCCSAVCTCSGGKVGNPETDQCHPSTFSNPLRRNVDGWYDWDDNADTWPGTLTTIQQIGNHAELKPGSAQAGELTPMTLWGGYSSVFPAGGYDTELDIRLEPDGTAPGATFRYSSAINNTGCAFLDEAIFNAGKGEGSNSSTFCVSVGGGDPCAAPNHVIIAPGDEDWYRFRHEFRIVGGNIQITLQLLRDEEVLGSWVDTGGPDVGGNRYGWFPFNEFTALKIRRSRRTLL